MRKLDKIRYWFHKNLGMGNTMMNHGAVELTCPECGRETIGYRREGSIVTCFWCDHEWEPYEKSIKDRLGRYEKETEDGIVKVCMDCGAEGALSFDERIFWSEKTANGIWGGFRGENIIYLCEDCRDRRR